MKKSQQFARRFALAAGTLALAAGLTACGSPAATAPAGAAQAGAAQASAAQPEAAQAAAEASIAMAASPQKLSPQQYQEEFAASGAAYQLIDVRTAEEFASGHIAGAVNIPVQELGGRLGEVSKDQPVVLYCRSGNRSGQAATLLERAGYTGIYDLGGLTAWQQAGFPLE